MTRKDFMLGTVAMCMVGCRSSGGGGSYPGWKPGEMDIHFIHTGCGEQTFFIFPDGTTMLLDCGDTHLSKYMGEVPPMPSFDRFAGEWVSRYIQRLVPQRTIDYLMVSHWHGDHIGDPHTGAKLLPDGREVVGITAVAEDFRFRHYFDHQYPNAGMYAEDPDPEAFAHFQAWLKKAIAAGMEPHRFEVGALNQIRLLNGAADYPGFEIRNLCANAVLWDGRDGRIDCGAAHVKGSGRRTISENRLSAAIRIRYGAFSYYTGGDNELTLCDADGHEYNWEQRIGRTCGPVDVCKTGHHAGIYGMSPGFVREVRAQVYLSSVWQARMVDRKSLSAMCSRELYPGDRIVCFGHIAESRRAVTAAYGADIAPSGHAVVKVAPGGDTFRVFVLTAADESMRVICERGFRSRGKESGS